MPCHDGRDSPEYVASEARDDARRDAIHNSVPAELLCWVLSHMEEPTKRKFLEANGPLDKWWRDHQERDRLKVIKDREARAKKIHNEAIDRQINALKRKRK